MRRHVIYVPGIGDNAFYFQGMAVRMWLLFGVRGHFHPMPWLGQEEFEPKFQRLLDEIDRYAAKGRKVSLVGPSAGASAILNAYLARRDKINGLVYICAKINGPETVEQELYDANPAFKTSIERLVKDLPKLTPEDKAKMLSVYSPGDKRVPYAATVIPGVQEKRLPPFKHSVAIAYAITFGAHGLLRFLKSLNTQA
jgi:pimeloyl-ACP methyl ester carboxylesterase